MNPRIINSFTALTFIAMHSAMATEIEQRPAPACATAAIRDAKNYTLQQFKGKVIYVDFWASWCVPCVQSFPFMNTLEHEFNSKDFQILAINLDENPDDAHLFLKQHPAQFTVVTDTNQQCAKAFDVKAMPSSYLIDRNGMIRYQHLGFHNSETEEIKSLVKQLLAEKTSTRP